MKESKKKAGTIRGIKKTTLTYSSKKAHYKLLESKVEPNQKIMIAVSGGADSILTASLVYIFFVDKKYDLQNLFFIHCNHNIREGNKDDETFIKQYFKNTQLIVTKRTKTTKATEATLRKRRYGEFKKYSKKNNIDQMVFGHNLTDRIESTFLNLLRGAHLNGFLAMQVQEAHHLLGGTKILRPILGISKDEVTEICKKNKIPFVIDPTNIDTTTSLRNKLRHNILPGLYKLANKQSTTTNSFIESMKNIYISLEESDKKKILNSEFGILHSIKKSPYRKAKFAYQRSINPNEITNNSIMQTIKELHISNNITTPLLEELTKFLKNSKSGYKYFNNTYIFKSHENIYIISAPNMFWQKTIDSEKKIDNITTKRFPHKGDRYKGKKRNEWCINQKIPIFRRNFIPIIVKKNQIEKVFR